MNVVDEKQIGSDGYDNGQAGNVKMQKATTMRQLLIFRVGSIMV